MWLQETGPALIKCLMKDIGFSEGKPVAAFTIYKCLLHWKSFEAERTTVFDLLIYMFDSAIKVLPQYDKESTSYLIYFNCTEGSPCCRRKMLMIIWRTGYQIYQLCYS